MLLLIHSKVHNPLKTLFVLGTQHEIKGINNANPTLTYPTQTIFHWITLGLALGVQGLVLGVQGLVLGIQGLAFGP